HQALPVFAEIHPVSGPEIDPALEHAGTDSFDVREIAARQSGQGRCHLGGCLRIQAVKPCCVWAATFPVVVFSNINHGYGNTYVTIVKGLGKLLIYSHFAAAGHSVKSESSSRAFT